MSIRKWAMLGAVVPALLAAMLFAACGDDDSGGSSSSDSGSSSNVKTGSDEQYVSDLCKSFSAYAASLTSALDKVGSGTSASDLDKFVQALVEPMEKFAKDFAKMKPPADLKDWHTQTAKGLADAVDQLKKAKDPNALADIGGSPVGDMPKAAEERLAKLAANNKDCKTAGGLFSE